jgi:hypothetical protein
MDPVKRAQFAKMIVNALYLQVWEGMPLPDVWDLGPNNPNDLYPHEYVAAAYHNDITKGTGPHSFSPWANITRAQVMTMIVGAAQKFARYAIQPVPAGFKGFLPGWFTADHTHGTNGRLAEWNNLLMGIDLQGWDPWQPATRGEVAQMLYNLMKERGPEVCLTLF